MTDVDDPRFKETFEDVFTADDLQGAGFFKVIAGNHDHYGNVSAQIAYAARENSRWYVRRAEVSPTNRGDAAAATWIVRGDESRRRRDVDIPRFQVAATPLPGCG